jgi:hypothetical protein
MATIFGSGFGFGVAASADSPALLPQISAMHFCKSLYPNGVNIL